MDYPVTRTPEQGHTKRCLARAVIAAVENLRDIEHLSDVSFAISLQENEPRTMAFEYLNNGMMACVCPALPRTCKVCGRDINDHEAGVTICDWCPSDQD